MIPLAKPAVTHEEAEAVYRVVASGVLSGGPLVPQFEAAMANQCQTAYAVAVNSGTSALHCALLASGIGPGDEVITTPFSFVASANCIEMVGARPVFVDIDPLTWNLDATHIAGVITPRTRAILAVDLFGRCADWTTVTTIAEQHGLLLIEDACEALGATHAGRPAGSFGDVAVLGFYPNKQLVTGEGGMVLTPHTETALMARSLRNHGRVNGENDGPMVRLGYNYRLTEMQAALGLSQLARLPEMLQRRALCAARYTQLLPAMAPTPCTSVEIQSWFTYVVQVPHREAVIERMAEAGIACGRYFSPIHLQPYYRKKYGYQNGAFPITERVAWQAVALPLYPTLTIEHQDYICKTLREIV